jgi:hypothetical protein
MILLITPQQVVAKTPLNGNIDFDKIVPCIEDAQITDLEPLIGQVLYDKICTDFENDDLADNYLTLYNDFIVDFLIRATAKNVLLVLAYQISNGGVYKHTAENAESVSKSEVDYLMVQQRSKQEVFGLRMQKWLSYNRIPEYTKHSDTISRKKLNVGSWWFGNNSCNDCGNIEIDTYGQD